MAKIILAAIKAHAQAVTLDEAAVVDRLKRQITQHNAEDLFAARQEIRQLRRRTEELEGLIAKLYEDKYSGAVSESAFSVLMQKNEQERLAKAERLDALLSVEQKTADIQNWAALIRKHLNLQELYRAAIDELIDHIEIGGRTVADGERKQDVKVYYPNKRIPCFLFDQPRMTDAHFVISVKPVLRPPV